MIAGRKSMLVYNPSSHERGNTSSLLAIRLINHIRDPSEVYGSIVCMCGFLFRLTITMLVLYKYEPHALVVRTL